MTLLNAEILTKPAGAPVEMGEPGKLAVANYEPFDQQLLGHGKHARTVRGHDMLRKRHVAIKKLSRDRDWQLSWQSATFAMAHIHRCFVNVLDVDEDRHWIIMELMSSSLQKHAESQPLAASRAPVILSDALEGLTYLESLGKLHGAIRPSNLLLDDVGHAKLADARGYSPGEPWPQPGTDDRHMPPELVESRYGNLGPASDLYCLASTMIHALLGPKFDRKLTRGKLVFGGPKHDWPRWHASATAHWPRAADLIPSLDPNTADLLDRMLQKNVEDRFTSAAAALAAFSFRDRRIQQQITTTSAPQPRTFSSASSINFLGTPQSTNGDTQRVRVIAAPGAAVRGMQTRAAGRETSWRELLRWDYLKQVGTGRVVRFAGVITAVLLVGAMLLPTRLPTELDVIIRTDPLANVEFRTFDRIHRASLSSMDWQNRAADEDGNLVLALPIGGKYVFQAKKGKLKSNSHEDTIRIGMATIELPVDHSAPLARAARSPAMPAWTITISPTTARILVDGEDVTWRLKLTRRSQLQVKTGTIPMPGPRGSASPMAADSLHAIEVVAEGYRSEKRGPLPWQELVNERSIELQRDRRVRMRILPHESRVFVDGIQIPSQPDAQLFEFDWPESRSRVTVFIEKNGFVSNTISLLEKDIHDQWPHFLQIALEPIPESPPPVFSIIGVPAGGSITVDGRHLGNGPDIAGIEGNHDVVIVAPGFSPWHQELEFFDGGSFTVQLQLLSNTPLYTSPRANAYESTQRPRQ